MELSLRTNIVCITIAIIILSIGTNSAITSAMFVNEYTDALGERAFAAGQSLKTQLNRLLNLNIPIEELVGFDRQCGDLVKKYQGISAAYILNLKGEILFHNNPDQHGRIKQNIHRPRNHLSESTLFKEKDGNSEIYQTRIPIIDNHGETQGLLIVEFSDDIIIDKRNEMILASLITALFSVGIAIILVLILINYGVTKPLGKFIRDIQNIRSAKTEDLQLVESKSWHEINDLKIAFNGLMIDLNKSNKKVQDYTKELESKIRLRTSELTRANKKLQKDLIEIREAKDALRESDERYKTILDAVETGIIIIDAKYHRIADVNPAAMKVLGIEKEKLLGRVCHSFICPNERGKCPITDLGQKIDQSERFIVDGSGEKIPVLKSVNPIELNKESHLLESFIDLRGLKKAEKEKQELELRLLQAHKMESIGTLAGGIAHDFNNILSSVIGYTELALDEIEKSTLLEENLQQVYTAGTRAKDLVKQILTFARQSDEDIRPIKISTIAKEVLKLLRSSLPATIDIRHDINSDSLIMGDPVNVHQIIMNLCTNASHAMSDGGTLKVELSDIYLDYHLTKALDKLDPGNYLKLSISDTGTGIPPDIINSIFEPYFTTKGVGEGTGMGLAMVHGIVNKYGGEIVTKSVLGKGSKFTVYLPVASTHEEKDEYKPEELPKGKERILFVDDEVDIAAMTRQTLEKLGYRVEIRTSPIEALEYFRSKSEHIDLVITDFTMPNMTGDKMAIEMMKIKPSLPVIMCTGYSNKITTEKAQKIGIKAFVYKPVIKTKLANTVRSVLDESAFGQVKE